MTDAVYFGRLRPATTELPIDRGRQIWGLFLDPILDLLKSHVLANYAEYRLTALQLGYDPSNMSPAMSSVKRFARSGGLGSDLCSAGKSSTGSGGP